LGITSTSGRESAIYNFLNPDKTVGRIYVANKDYIARGLFDHEKRGRGGHNKIKYFLNYLILGILYFTLKLQMQKKFMHFTIK